MRPWSTLAAACLAAAVSASLAPPPAHSDDRIFTADATLTYLGEVGGQQRYRLDYTLTNLGEPWGLAGFQVFFNSDPDTQQPTGDRATFVSLASPAGWEWEESPTVTAKNAAGQWSVDWAHDYATPPGPVQIGQSLSGFSVDFDWNDCNSIPGIQHAQARNGAAKSASTRIAEHIGLTGTIRGVVTVSCGGTPQSAAGITIKLRRDADDFDVEMTGIDGSYEFSNVPLGTYAVRVISPAGLATPVDCQVVQVQLIEQVATASFELSCQLATIRGTVTGTCAAGTAPLPGVTVDLFSVDGAGNESLVAVAASDAAGHYRFPDIALGNYFVAVVTPLGYSGNARSSPIAVAAAGATLDASFALACRSSAGAPRTIGYWKHQVNSHLTGKGKAQESLNTLLGYTDLLLTHFNGNIINPVVIYVSESSIPNDRLQKLERLLTVNRGGTRLDHAKQHLLALLLNVVAGYLSQTQPISADGATVSQAITHCNDLIRDGDPSNDEVAKTIADLINNGQLVPRGTVPTGTRLIYYSNRPADGGTFALELAPAHPNPSRGPVALGFSTPRAGEVEVRIFDASGRAVRTLARAAFAAGRHALSWDGSDDDGRRVAPGVYFVRLLSPEGNRSRSVVMER